MRLGFAARLFLLAVALLSLLLLGATSYLTAVLERQLLARAEHDLLARTLLLADRLASIADDRAPEALADELAVRARARVTILDREGRVLGDSAVAPEALGGLEPQRALPEVAAALRDGGGSATRGEPGRTRVTYAAAAFAHAGSGRQGIVRAAAPADHTDATVSSARTVLVLTTTIALVVALLLWATATRRVTLVVRSLTATARRLARGELDARARVEGDGQLAELGTTLDRLAANLMRAIGDLRGERDLLSGVLEAMDEGVLLIDGRGRVALVNRALREMLLLPSGVVGMRPMEAIRHSDLQALVERAVESHGPVSGEIDMPGVKPRRLLVHATALRGGQPGVLTVFVDVTDLRRLETVRRDFVANVSHELRTPVTAIRSAAETLSSGAADDPAAGPRFLDVIERNAARLQSLVEDLLDLSRIESRQYRFRPEPLELVQVLSLVEEGLRERAARAGAVLRSDVPPGLPRVEADRRGLEQILTNLLENAIKYGGGTVTTRASAAGGKVHIQVSDSGPGIEERHLSRIFERFYRVDSGRSRDQGGTGLGLAIVKNLAEAMRGSVGVTSSPGEGATFSVTLPAAPPSEPVR